jgi:hypothetical protein
LAECFDKALNADGHLIRVQKLVEMTSVLPWFRDRIEVERKAHEIREYEPYQIPGLLQTRDYAHASVSAARPMHTEDTVERAVALRMTRQEILKSDQQLPPESAPGHMKLLWAIIDESALHRVVGSQQVMQVQRDYLADMVIQPHITIQIMSYLEDVKDAHYLRNRDQVAQYALVFDHLRSLALDDGRSLKLIKGEK